MWLILLVWVMWAIPASPCCGHLIWEPGVEFLKELQDNQNVRQWKAGTYRGITTGKSTATEIFQKWGKPKYIGHWDWDNPKNPKYRLYHYDAQEAHIGAIMVVVEMKTGKVEFISATPDELPLNKATELFGEDYIKTRYKRCTCDPDYESPIFESPDGYWLYVEYRSRGIAMRVDDGLVTSIRFGDKPIGFKSAKECEKIPECRPKRKSVKQKRI
jgi:hypothetical protein